MIVAGVLTLLSLTYTVFVRVNLAMVAVSFLLVVLVSATYWGLAESLAASAILISCFFLLSTLLQSLILRTGLHFSPS
jgi:hypothetical protein